MNTVNAVEKGINRARRYVRISAETMRAEKRMANRWVRHQLANRLRAIVSANELDADTVPARLSKLTSWDQY